MAKVRLHFMQIHVRNIFSSGTVEEHKKRYAQVNIEMICLYVVTLIVTLAMMVPVFWTGMSVLILRIYTNISIYIFIIVLNINERHSLLSRTIGTHPLENESHYRANLLLVLAPIILILSLTLELLLYIIYSRKVFWQFEN